MGDVAARTGAAVSALRFYERQGLFASARTAGGQRRFARHVLRRVSVIQVAKRMDNELGSNGSGPRLLPEFPSE